MKPLYTEDIKNGKISAVITANTEAGPFYSRLWLNSGETASLISAKAKTLKGARTQAQGMIDAHLRRANYGTGKVGA